jgi:regulator of protease activity HflC (stomatin/prohibitin superfamily)
MFLISVSIIAALAMTIAAKVMLNRASAGALAGLGLVAVVLALESFTVVPAGHVGVQVTLGTVNQTALPEGAQFVNPISNVKYVDVRLQKANLNGASAGTRNIQQVHTDIVVNYRMSPSKVPYIYKEFGLDVDSKVLGPAINEAFKSVVGHFTSEELITKRDEVNTEIVARLSEKLAPFDLIVNNISLVNFGFSKAYQDSIEAKVIAEQQKLKADQDLQRIKVEAASRIAQAEGEAKAIAIQASAIQSQGGAAYVQLQAIEKWNGQLPSTMLGNSTPFVNVGK